MKKLLSRPSVRVQLGFFHMLLGVLFLGVGIGRGIGTPRTWADEGVAIGALVLILLGLWALVKAKKDGSA